MNATSPALPPALIPLVGYLDGLQGRADLPELVRLLRNPDITLECLRDFLVFDPKHYRRNIVSQGQWYSLLAICWRSGQRSPIHDHKGSSCCFKVMTGVCSETIYEFGPCGQVVPVKTINRPVASLVASQDEDTHQVSNLQPANQDLVTLHIYSPPLKAMNLFSILGDPAQNWNAPENAGADMKVPPPEQDWSV